MMKKVGIGSLAMAGIAIPLFAFGGIADDDPQGAHFTGQLDLSRIPAAYQSWVAKAAGTCDAVEGALLPAQLDQESAWNPHAQSSAGARGLAQFTDDTWKLWGIDADGDGADVYDGPDAIMTMARYDCWLASHAQKLADQHLAVGDLVSLMLAGYNAGPGAISQYGGVPPYPETQQYVRTVLAKQADYTKSLGENGSSFGARVVAAAVRQEGTPYSWGGGTVDGASYGVAQGANTRGYDCSGLVLYAIYQASGGKTTLPHSSQQQATMGRAVVRADMQPGDVIAIQLGAPGDYDHIGIYVGNGVFVHAPKTGDVVKKANLSDPYYAHRTITIRRFG